MTPLAARDLADRALLFIAGDEALTTALLAASGADAAGLRRMAATPEFAVFVIDFLLEDGARVLAFAEDAGVAPDSLLAAREALDPQDRDWA